MTSQLLKPTETEQTACSFSLFPQFPHIYPPEISIVLGKGKKVPNSNLQNPRQL